MSRKVQSSARMNTKFGLVWAGAKVQRRDETRKKIGRGLFLSRLVLRAKRLLKGNNIKLSYLTYVAVNK